MKQNGGYTLVEIMIVVLIISLLAIIAAPSFMRARQGSRAGACVNNLHVVSSVKEQYALEAGLEDGGDASSCEREDYMSGGLPVCPIEDTAYTINEVGTNPVCPNYDEDTHLAAFPAP